MLKCGLQFADPLFVDALNAAAHDAARCDEVAAAVIHTVHLHKHPPPAVVHALCSLVNASHVQATMGSALWSVASLAAGELVHALGRDYSHSTDDGTGVRAAVQVRRRCACARREC